MQPFGQHRTLPVTALQAEADELTEQFRQQEALAMSQTVENLGGPGSNRSRYVRALMTTPYSVHPLLPYMAGSPLGSMTPPGAGSAYTLPGEDWSPTQGAPEMTALETGITHTASVAEDIGRALAKTAHEGRPPMYEESGASIPPQYYQAITPQQPTHGALAKAHARQALGSSLSAIGHGALALGGAVGRGARDFAAQEPMYGQRWGTGYAPEPMTNEYGVPLRI